jgi:para-nitrobenzyl esterase
MKKITDICKAITLIAMIFIFAGCMAISGSHPESNLNSEMLNQTEAATQNDAKFAKVVSTRYGDVEGLVAANGAVVWKALPFAKPPSRFMLPENPASWSGVLDAKNDSKKCVQLDRKSGEMVGSEDCLYLNIWRPDNNTTDLPVYFWIHGGGNNSGSAQQFDGAHLAQKSNMVVVATQYRLGPLGWLTHPALRKEEKNPLAASGNFGTLDIIQALKWVQANIGAFGGAADNVTIAGISAGARNVLSLISSPVAKGLFHKAISQSGGTKTLTIAEGDAKTASTVTNLLKLSGLSAVPDGDVATFLKNAAIKNLYAARISSGVDFSYAHADGTVIPTGGPIAAILSGGYNKVPIILGSNRDEMKYFMPHFGATLKNAVATPAFGINQSIPSGKYLWSDLIQVLSGALTVNDVLPTSADKQLYEACAETASLNWRFGAVDNIANAMKMHQDDIYAYQFNWDGVDGSGYQFVFGAAHVTEMPFFLGQDKDIFHGAAFGPGYDTKGRQELADSMMDSVSMFVRTGDPNRTNTKPLWRQWSSEEGAPKVLVWDANDQLQNVYMVAEEITQDKVAEHFTRHYVGLPIAVRNALFFFKWDRQ